MEGDYKGFLLTGCYNREGPSLSCHRSCENEHSHGRVENGFKGWTLKEIMAQGWPCAPSWLSTLMKIRLVTKHFVLNMNIEL